MKKIALLGGSYDPCHFGHINLALDAKEQMDLDSVILVPAKIQPFKQNKEVIAPRHRYNMTKLAIENYKGLFVSDIELNRSGVSYTYQTMDDMKSMLGESTKLYFLCGIDTFIGMKTWKNADILFKNSNFIVGVRPGYKKEEFQKLKNEIERLYGTEINEINNRKLPISSTLVRKLLIDGDNVSNLIPEAVERYIKANGLYR